MIKEIIIIIIFYTVNVFVKTSFEKIRGCAKEKRLSVSFSKKNETIVTNMCTTKSNLKHRTKLNSNYKLTMILS